jgi:hypothetical protein
MILTDLRSILIKFFEIAGDKPQLNSSNADEPIATQECSTGVTEAGIKKIKM